MGRPKGSKNKIKVNIDKGQNTLIPPVQNVGKTEEKTEFSLNDFGYPIDKNNPDKIDMREFQRQYAERFSLAYDKYLEHLGKYQERNIQYNPIYANQLMKDVNQRTPKPTVQDIISFLNNPNQYENELKNVSEFLSNAVMQYARSLGYLSNILYMGYETIALNSPNIEDFKTQEQQKKEKTIYNKDKQRVNKWLNKFRVQEQFTNITKDVMKYGGRCYYVREASGETADDNSISLQAMPDKYCYINGRTAELGFTYGMDMTFFKQFPETMAAYAPEFALWYAEFIFNSQKNGSANPFRRMSPDKSVVFKFDDTNVKIIPPMSGVFKDAVEISDYKDLLKLKAELDVYQILYLEIPCDEKGVPTIDAIIANNYAAAVQALLPQGFGCVTAPMKASDVKTNNAQNMNTIIGTGENNYWASAGIATALFNETKSAVGIRMAVEKDFAFVSSLYDQYERFINYHLYQICGKYKFKIKFVRIPNFPTFISAERKEALTLATVGGSPSRLAAAYNYTDCEFSNILNDFQLTGIWDKMMPLKNTNQMSFKNGESQGGRPTSEETGNEITDSQDQTESGGYNEDE